MSRTRLSGIVFCVSILVILIWDLYAFLALEDGTISIWFWELNARMPWLGYIIVYILGLLTAHLFPVFRAHKVIEVEKE